MINFFQLIKGDVLKFSANKPRIVDEDVEGEIIIIDTLTGSYYSMRGSAAWLWLRIAQGAAPEELAEQLRGALPAKDAEEIKVQIHEFIQALLKDELIRPCDVPIAAAAKSRSSKPPASFEKPVYEKFEDMQEYLLADPIHDVDESGWPHLKDAPPSGNPEEK